MTTAPMVSQRAKDIVIGTLLGDAHIAMLKTHARLEIVHSEKQKSYVFWKYRELSHWTGAKPHRVKFYDSRWNATYVQWRFRTRCDAYFSHLHSRFYARGRKTIPSNIHTFLKSPMVLAVWFMDDGGRRNDSYGLFLNTLSFTKAENELLRLCLQENHTLDSRLHWVQDGYRIYIPSRDAKRFCEIVSPYLIPSLKYKLSYNPVTTSFARLNRARDRRSFMCL